MSIWACTGPESNNNNAEIAKRHAPISLKIGFKLPPSLAETSIAEDKLGNLKCLLLTGNTQSKFVLQLIDLAS